MLFLSSNSSSRSNCSNPLLHPAPRRGGGKRWRLERSVAIEPSVAIERIEQFSMRSGANSTSNCSMSCIDK